MRLAVDRAAREERGVAAEDEPVDRLALVRAPDDRLGLGLREQLHQVGCLEWAGFRLPGRHDGLLVDARRDGDRLDPGGAEGLQPGGRRGGEVQAHVPILPVRARAVECSEHGRTPSPPSPEPAWRWAASPHAPRAARSRPRRSRRRARRRARRPRRRLRGAPRGAGRVRARRDPGRARVGAHHRPAARPVLAGRDARRAAGLAGSAGARVGGGLRRTGAGEPRRRCRVRPHPDGAAARAEGGRAARRPLAHGRRRRRRGGPPGRPGARSRRRARRHRVAHPRAAPGRRRRRRRPVRGAEPHGGARGIRPPRRARARSPGAPRRAVPRGTRRRPRRARAWGSRRSWWSTASGCRPARARPSRSASATARSGSTATDSGRCTAARPRRSPVPCRT